jgi:hypothetical protein
VSEIDSETAAELAWLRHNQADLDARLRRVEDSLLFRALRAAGSFFQSYFQLGGAAQSDGYRAWASRHLRPAPPPDPHWPYQPAIAVTGNVDAMRTQTYTNWATDPATADYLAEVPAGVVLQPDALARAIAAMQDAPPALVYFDHQLAGDSPRPVFKPDWSPVLAESCDYTGPFVLRSRAPRLGALHIPHIAYTAPTPLRFHESHPQPAVHPLVSILICTRDAGLLERCLHALHANTDYPALETVVIHHTGSPSHARIVELTRDRAIPRVPFSDPFNFAEMNNRGALAAKGEILLFLNDDVEPLDPRWLSRMTARLERPEIGAVGAKLLYANGSIQHAGIVTWETGGAGHPGRFMTASDYWPWLNSSREVTAVTGACLAIRRADFHSLGGFDPRFPVNFNDVDLCLRLRARGLSIVLETGAQLEHRESSTRQSGVTFHERRAFFLRWHALLQRTDPFYSPHLAQNIENLSLRD